MKAVGALALVLILLAAGCLKAPDVQTASVKDAAVGAMHKLVSFDAKGIVPTPASFAGFHVRLAKTGFSAGEPSMGVTSDGTLFVAAGSGDIVRSTDHGMTWESLKSKDPVRTPKASLDNWVWVDPVTDRVYDAPLYVACTWAAWSDDKGDSWDVNPVAGCGVPAHDHQKLTTGVPAKGIQVTGYKDVVYYSYNSFRKEGTWISPSYDGGRTFVVGQMVHPYDQCHSGIASPVIVANDGTAYSGHPTCDGVSIAASTDSGATWSKPTVITDVGAAQALAHMVDVATDKANNSYVTWTGKNGAAYYVFSTDQGASWSKPVRASPPTLGATVYNTITADAAGRIVIGYLGTEDDATKWKTPDAQNAADTTVWHAYMTFIDNATSADPVATTVQLTPNDDPVQIGCIWQSGGSSACRNLDDFIDIEQVGGRPYLVFADGCDKCTKNTDSRKQDDTVAIVEVGPSLETGAPLAPLMDMAAHDHNAPQPQPLAPADVSEKLSAYSPVR